METKKFYYYAGDAKLSWALKREYAVVGAKVIASGNYGPVLELAGRPCTFKAAEIATNQSIDIQEISKNDFNPTMAQSGISEMGLMLATMYQDYAIAGNNGEAQSTLDEFERVLGHPLISLSDALKELTLNK